MAGKVNCKLSSINIISPKIFVKECIEGIRRPSVTPEKTTSTRKLHIDFCRKFCAVLGQSPIKFKVKRFSFTAHSKSTCRDLNKSEIYQKDYSSFLNVYKVIVKYANTKYYLIECAKNSI